MISVRSEVQVFPGPPILALAARKLVWFVGRHVAATPTLHASLVALRAEERHANPASGLDLVRKQDTGPHGFVPRWQVDL